MKTEIFATFGPACGQENILQEMIGAGMTGMRLNLSHTTLPDSESYIRAYQNAATKAGVKPQLLIDMQGPELRVGEMSDTVVLKQEDRVFLCAPKKEDVREIRQDGEPQYVSIPVPKQVLQAAEVGDKILLDDGKILVEVVEKTFGIAEEASEITAEKPGAIEAYINATVLRGGRLQSHKSVKIVGKNVKMPALTSHDIDNIKQAKGYGVTALMQPFVLCGEELRYVRQILREHGAEDIQIFAKIENRLGVENLENILPEADVIVIARGDLGNDMPLWELPRVQKEIEEACHKYGKPYIVVTQMLASMEITPVPTRAEVSDIFHAVYHGAWGVMVTGETAVGKYPVEAIRYLTNTAEQACGK